MKALESLRASLVEWLVTAAYPLWSHHGIDPRNGGFAEALDGNGHAVALPRRARVHPRQVYAFAQAQAFGWQGDARGIVSRGMDFFETHYRRADGLFLTLAGADGAALDERALLYDQAFALLGYAAAATALDAHSEFEQRALALRHAIEAHFLAQDGAYNSDEESAGYRESNPHMHLLEAYLAWAEIGHDAGWATGVQAIAELALSRFINRDSGSIGESYLATWQPAPGIAGRVVEPGHQFEWAWLLLRCERWHSAPALRGAALRLIEIGDRFGVRDGVAVDALYDDFSIKDARARFWPQTERLKAALLAAGLTGEPHYEAMAEAAVSSFFPYLNSAVPGLWRDVRLPNGEFIGSPVPASTFYHLVGAIAALSFARRPSAPRPGRNHPCPCGSGKKYKECCGQIAAGAAAPHMTQLASLIDAGRYVELESKARELLELHPSSGIIWQLLGLSLTRQGRDSLQALEMAAQLLPNDAGAHNNLANALGRLGRLDDAVAHYRRALRQSPDFAEAHNNLGHALLDLGQFDEAAASCRRAAELKPGLAEAHDNLGSAQLALGRLDDALASYRRALEIEPDFAEAHSNLGNLWLEFGRIDEALGSYRQAIAIDPNLAEAHNNLGNGLRNLGKLEDAAASYGRALEINPKFAEAHCNLGVTLRLQGRTEEAQASCRRALEINPQSAEALVAWADSSADVGQFAQAEELFKRAIAAQPDSPEAWAGLARSRKMTVADVAWLAQAQRIVGKGLPPRHEICLRHAIGKYFDDLQDFEQAFVHFRRANELTGLRRAKHDRRQLTRTVEVITRFWDRNRVNGQRADASESDRPVFIVGMPRSGTTLVEQILASHPAVFGAGELTFWSAAWAAHAASPGNAEMSDSLLRTLADKYLRSLRRLSDGASRVIDKMPTNFPFLGLIHAALPNARIIHVRRNPLDTCLSIYTQPFETAVSYANDLDDLAHYYTEYLRVMDHWRSTLPANVILDVSYEGLVSDQEAWSRRMLEFIGLPWDSRCLDFHRTERTVLTASKWQVRQKLHGSSIGRWRHYEKFLGALSKLAALDAP
jgi:mannose/cellobiose epimerase-like protein (N-acyl-D-glucosamine 2-epimerase family)/Tfp pilus assembly protein PilF